MIKKILSLFVPACLSAVAVLPVSAEQPVILSFDPNSGITWTNPVQGNLSIFQRSTNLTGADWNSFFYDWGTNGLFNTPLPSSASDRMFYRVAVQTNIPDPSLIVRLSFDNIISNGVVLDISGHENHGRRYGRPGYPTNWPTATMGPDGSLAAEFHQYFDGFGRYGKSGDYVAIPFSPGLTNLTQATICAWVHYYTAEFNDINNDHNTSILDTGKDVPGTWNFGRQYSDFTVFSVWSGLASQVDVLTFPDSSPTGNSGGWHYYSITFSNGVTKGYFDGALFGTANAPVSALTMAGYYIGVAGWTFNETPEMDLAVDEHPNNAWINGTVDDIRIYNRALSGSEISALYLSFDKLPPSAPTNLTAAVISSSGVKLGWSPASGTFPVAGYILSRNGVPVVNTTNTLYFDLNLTPESTNIYTVQSFDVGGNISANSPAVTAVTLAPGGGVDLVIDDADGQPWITQQGPWPTYATQPGYYGTGFLSSDKVTGKSLIYQPPLPESGNYTVYIRYPGKSSIGYLLASAVPVDIVHNGTTNTVFVNEQSNFGTWNSLGQYSFTAGTNDYVRIRTDGTSGYYVFADAIRFVK